MSAPVIAWATGIHPDARTRQVARQVAPRIAIPRNTDCAVAITVRYSDNSRVDLTGAALKLTLAKSQTMADVLATLAADLSATAGDALFDLARADTADAALGGYFYTVEAVWSDGKRSQLIPVTSCLLVASAPSDQPVVGAYRALDVGAVLFDGDTELDVTFDAAITGEYRVVLTAGRDTETGSSVYPQSTGESSTGFTVSLSGPFKGRVTYAIYPA